MHYNTTVFSLSGRDRKKHFLDYPLIAGLFLLVFIFSLRRLADYDLWGHLKAGQYLFQNGSILTTHYFNFNRPDFPYLNHEWLFQAVTYAAYAAGGEAALIFLQIALVMASFFLLFRIVRLYSDAIPLIVLVIGLGVLASTHRFALRPQHFTYLFLVIHLYCLHLYSRGSTKALYVMPVVMLLWVNIHAESLWGVLVPGIYLSAEGIAAIRDRGKRAAFRKFVVAYLLVIAASLLNPFTYKTVIWPLLVMSEQFAGVEELLPPVTLKFLYFWIYFGIFLVSLPFAARKIRLHFILIAIFFSVVAWTANRGIPHFVFASAPVIAAGFGSILKDPWKERSLLIARPVLLVLLLFVSIHVIADRHYFRKFDMIPYPEGAVRFIRDNGIQGNMFNLHGWGGYLVWELFPEVRTYIDNRFFHKTFFNEYTMIISGGANTEQILNKHKISTVLLDYSPSRSPNIRDYLFSSLDWRLVYWDDTSLLYLRKDSGYKHVLDKYAMRVINPDTDRFQLAGPGKEIIPAALKEVLKNREHAEDSWKVNYMAGSLFYASGDFGNAVSSFRRAQGQTVDPVPAVLFNLGMAHMASGKFDEAEENFEAVVRLAPQLQAFAALRKVYELQGKKAEAEAVYEKYLKAVPPAR